MKKTIILISLTIMIGIIIFSSCMKEMPAPTTGIYNYKPNVIYNNQVLIISPPISGVFNWSKAKNICDTLTAFGYNDWRLPTFGELKTIYKSKDKIGKFDDAYYWSYDTVLRSDTILNFKNGFLNVYNISSSFNCRCVSQK